MPNLKDTVVQRLAPSPPSQKVVGSIPGLEPFRVEFPRGVLSLSVGVRVSLSASGYWRMDGLDENSEVVSSAVVTKTRS